MENVPLIASVTYGKEGRTHVAVPERSLGGSATVKTWEAFRWHETQGKRALKGEHFAHQDEEIILNKHSEPTTRNMVKEVLYSRCLKLAQPRVRQSKRQRRANVDVTWS